MSSGVKLKLAPVPFAKPVVTVETPPETWVLPTVHERTRPAAASTGPTSAAVPESEIAAPSVAPTVGGEVIAAVGATSKTTIG